MASKNRTDPSRPVLAEAMSLDDAGRRCIANEIVAEATAAEANNWADFATQEAYVMEMSAGRSHPRLSAADHVMDHFERFVDRKSEAALRVMLDTMAADAKCRERMGLPVALRRMRQGMPGEQLLLVAGKGEAALFTGDREIEMDVSIRDICATTTAITGPFAIRGVLAAGRSSDEEKGLGSFFQASTAVYANGQDYTADLAGAGVSGLAAMLPYLQAAAVVEMPSAVSLPLENHPAGAVVKDGAAVAM